MKEPKQGECRLCEFFTLEWAYWCTFHSVQLHQRMDMAELTEVAKKWMANGC